LAGKSDRGGGSGSVARREPPQFEALSDVFKAPEGWRLRQEKQRAILDEVKTTVPDVLRALAGEPAHLYRAWRQRGSSSEWRSPKANAIYQEWDALARLASDMADLGNGGLSAPRRIGEMMQPAG
jgi:hypothetical protein